MKLKFNGRLVEDIPQKDRGLAKIILFCFQEDLNLKSFVEEKGIINRINEISGTMWQNGQAVEDIFNNRIVPAEPLYLEESTKVPENFDIQRVRKYFSKKYIGMSGKLSNKPKVTRVLSDWFLENPGYSMDDVEKATEMYVNHCIRTGRMLMDVDNFINNGDDSTLLDWVEELSNSDQQTEGYGDGVL